MTAPPTPVPVLRARVDVRRRALGLTWWQVGLQASIGASALARLSMDVASLPTRRALEEWLRRHPSPAPAPDH
ncbi:hypothetical protein ACBJ59_61165 [Nonomuraea sp. MTCD27]|uniref:hypothetical protein n=1 Tax=Nonomuraea sp. MTCD27 TaxID=1676747 RepID=UPI0035C03AB1